MSAEIRVEVVYALPARQWLRRVTLAEGCRVADALEASGLLREFPQLAAAPVGIFGAKVQPGALLRDGDRVEIYRPLELDPKELRRRRAGRRPAGR